MSFTSFKPRCAASVFLLLALCLVAPANAEDAPSGGQVLTMTGLRRDPVKMSSKTMIFTGLKRQTVDIGPGSTEKTQK